MLRDILRDEADAVAAAALIAAADPDVLLLTGFDYDLDGHALAAFADLIARGGTGYPYRFAFAPNTGVATGQDLDGDGRKGGPRDAQGYGTFAGQGGMAVLSRLPIKAEESRDFAGFLWRDLPGALLPEGVAPEQRLSSAGHWDVALTLPDGRPIRLWAWHATPPVFDGPEDRNGRRNHDEAAFWLRYLDGALPLSPVDAPFVLLGDANLDPDDGEGRPEALVALLSHPVISDPRPRASEGARAASRDGGVNGSQRGDPAMDTANWPDGPGEPGNLRVDYVLPSAVWHVAASGIRWPDAAAPVASRHGLVWVDLELP